MGYVAPIAIVINPYCICTGKRKNYYNISTGHITM